jgi:transcriptional regulator with PAS, ATPase and Fis domain
MDVEATATDHRDSAEVSGAAGAEHRYLLLVSDGALQQTYALEDGCEIVFGRDPSVGVRVDDMRVSRRHARINRQRNRIMLEDLRSRNGTKLNDCKLLRKTLLGCGDRIQIGPLEVVLAVLRSPIATAEETCEVPAAGIVIADREMRRVFSIAERLSRLTTTVLLLGETGVGKEVVARAIHRGGPRRNAPFVQLNCAATPEHLLESELFGYERGAFTGAHQRKLGQIEIANGGTVFLDEIGELRPELQAKLLTFLQARTICRLGSNQPVALDVRVVAATNRDLEKEVASGGFRADLYFRLCGFVLSIPPLRERRSEIGAMAQLFLRSLALEANRSPPALGSDAVTALLNYDWPGNVRQLRNAISHALVLADATVNVEHLPGNIGGRTSTPAPEARLSAELDAIERGKLEQALRDESNNRTRAARRLGISRRSLLYKIEKFGL